MAFSFQVDWEIVSLQVRSYVSPCVCLNHRVGKDSIRVDNKLSPYTG